MSTSSHFKVSAQNLQECASRASVTLDVYALLNLTEQLVTHGINFAEPEPPVYGTHTQRVVAAMNSTVVMDYMRAGKKINAIKELRALTLCGLKEAKDAVEDNRVADLAGIERHRPGW